MQHPLVLRRLWPHTNADFTTRLFSHGHVSKLILDQTEEAIRRCRLCDSCIDDIQYVVMPHGCIRVFNIIHVCLYKGITGNSVTWYVLLEDVSDSAISVASCSAQQQKNPLSFTQEIFDSFYCGGREWGRTVVFLLAVEMDIGEDLRITSFLTVNGWWWNVLQHTKQLWKNPGNSYGFRWGGGDTHNRQKRHCDKPLHKTLD